MRVEKILPSIAESMISISKTLRELKDNSDKGQRIMVDNLTATNKELIQIMQDISGEMKELIVNIQILIKKTK